MIRKLFSFLKLAFRILFSEELILFRDESIMIVLHKLPGNYVPYTAGILAGFEDKQIAVSLWSWKYFLTAQKFYGKERFPFKIVIRARRNTLVITKRGDLIRSRRNKTFSFDYLNHLNQTKHSPVLFPFVMHSSHYKTSIPQVDLDSQRDVRLFFSGNSARKNYNKAYFNEVYGILNRCEILDTVRESSSLSSLTSFSKKVVKPLWLLDWQWSPIESNNLENRIPNAKWFDYLLNADFFLCCPGINMPMCHHTIEAMACGSIPILEYPKLFSPPLEDQKNCMVFKGKNGLIDVLKHVLEMTPNEIRDMRTNVSEYFKTNLHPNNLKALLLDPNIQDYALLVNVKSLEAYMNDKNFPERLMLN